MSSDSFGTRGRLDVGDDSYEIFRMGELGAQLPYSLKVLLENLLRHEDGVDVTADDIRALAAWRGGATSDGRGSADDRELAFAPARILWQDFTGVPAVVDLAAMRDAIEALGGDPARVDPLIPAELVIDHSVIADVHGTARRLRPQRRARVRAQPSSATSSSAGVRARSKACASSRPTPASATRSTSSTSRGSCSRTTPGRPIPTPSSAPTRTRPMVNGLGVLGWGVGGIEAEAAMLGQPISMVVPPVVGFRLLGALPEGSTATDLVLTVTELLRRHGVVGKFVEFYGPGVSNVPVENRATIGNMSPEYGSTITIFPIDDQTLRYLRFTGRPERQVALVEAYAKEQGLWFDPAATPIFSETLELDLSTVVPSLAGPSRPQDRVPLDRAKAMFAEAMVASLPEPAAGTVDEADEESFPASDAPAPGTAVDEPPRPNGDARPEPGAGAPPRARPRHPCGRRRRSTSTTVTS